MDISTLKNQRGEIDLTDSVLLPAFVLASFVTTGIATASVAGYALADPAFSVGSETVSYAFAAAASSLVVMYVSNGPDLDSLEQEESIAFAGGLIFLVGSEFIPFIQDSVLGAHPAVGLVGSVIIGISGYIVAYY